jgi:hypothetical protein
MLIFAVVHIGCFEMGVRCGVSVRSSIGEVDDVWAGGVHGVSELVFLDRPGCWSNDNGIVAMPFRRCSQVCADRLQFAKFINQSQSCRSVLFVVLNKLCFIDVQVSIHPIGHSR